MAKTTALAIPTRADALRDATDDLNAVAEVLGWLNTLLRQIDEVTKQEGADPRLQLNQVEELTDIGRYLSTSWRGEAENMARKFEEALTEVPHE